MKITIPVTAVMTLLLINNSWVFSKPLVVQSCDRITVQVDDPIQHTMAHNLGMLACHQVGRLEKLFGIRQTIRIRVFSDMQTWRRRVLRAWYIASVVQDGWILMQPVSSLEKLDNLAGTLVHEMAHLFIHQRAGQRCPHWLDEGLAQVLAGQRVSSERVDSVGDLKKLETRLARPDDGPGRRQQDYAKARALVIKILQHVSLEQLIAVLPTLTNGGWCCLSSSIAGQSLREILFDKG